MQHQPSNSNASTTIGPVKSRPTANHASEKIARFAAAEATCSMQLKRARNSLRRKQETWERIWLVETALRAAQRSIPHASSGVGCSDRQLSTQTPSVPPVGTQPLNKSRIVALISVAVVLPSLVGLAVWLSAVHSPLAHRYLPSPVLTAPAVLEATAGETILLPIALDGTDGVPVHSTIAITGLPQGSTLSDGRPYGETVWKLERNEIGDLHLVLPNNAGGQANLTIQLISPDATVVADAEILLQIATISQHSLPQNAEPRDVAGLAPAIVLGGALRLQMRKFCTRGPKRMSAQCSEMRSHRQPRRKKKKNVCRWHLALCNPSLAHPLRPPLLMLVRMRSRPRFSSISGMGLPPQQRSSAWSPKVPNCVS